MLGDIRLVESDGDPASLLETWQDADIAFVADAVVSGAAPGTLSRLDVGDLEILAGAGHRSSHSLGLAEFVRLGRALGRLPRRLVIFGIEGSTFTPRAPMSPEVCRAAECLATGILALLLPRVP